MLTALHPLLLWGLAAVAVPILIHLLLRSRPKPRPWGAMRWLMLAAQAASRRWKLTNLLLLLLRCLAVVLACLAVSRIAIPALGGGQHLVVAIDLTAGMGPRRDEPGSLASAQAGLASFLAQAPWQRVSVITIDPRVAVVAERVRPAAAAEAIARLEAGALPGGLDDAVAAAEWSVADGADVLLVSDMQQDRGERLIAGLRGVARQVARWQVARPARNAWVGGIAALGDIAPEQGGELLLRVGGAGVGAALSVDGGPFLDLAGRAEAGLLAVRVPALAAGAHRLRVRLDDPGIAADDLLDLPVQVRGPVGVLGVRERPDWLVAALAAQPSVLACTAVRPADLSTRPLPEGGVVALRAPVADSVRLADWLQEGGVLWTTAAIAEADPVLRGLFPAAGTAAVPAGAWSSDEAELNASLRSAVIPSLRPLSASGAEALLRAGPVLAVAAYRVGRGQLVIESADLGADSGFTSRAAAPEWAKRIARRLTARAAGPLDLVAGSLAPASATGALVREGRTVALRPGAPVLAAPGLWTLEVPGRAPVETLVLPAPSEGVLDRPVPPEIPAAIAAAMPVRSGADLGLWLLIALLAIILVEGAVAAWAGRRYAA